MERQEANGHRLVRAQLGERADAVLAILDLEPLLGGDGPVVDGATVAAALNAVLFSNLLDRVPSAAAYVESRRDRGERIRFDHGALRTIRFPAGPTGALPPGEAAFTRLLLPLGYTLAGTYPLPRLRMTGRAYVHAQAPETMPQFFVSELHVDQFDADFAAAATAVFSTSRDPLGDASKEALRRLQDAGTIDLAAAEALLGELVAAFDRQHAVPRLADYEVLLGQSAEAAWIATEGNAFNHATDRVADVEALAAQERAAGRPMKDRVEVSATGRVRQTAHRAATVARPFLDEEGREVTREAPGSFYEFIARDVDPATGRLDLTFDSGNATGIFAMTRVGTRAETPVGTRAG
jgi:hypothetical protein